MDPDDEERERAALRNRERGRALKDRLSKDKGVKELFPAKVAGTNPTKELFPPKVASPKEGKAQMDQVDDTTVLVSGMFSISL